MFKQELGVLIGSHSQDVSRLFKRYGYNVKTPTVQNVLDACIVLKDDFKNELANIFSQTTNFSGSDISDWLNKGIAVLTGVKQINDKVAGGADAKPVATVEDDTQRILGFNPTLFYAIVVVIIILILLMVFKAGK